MQDVCDNGEHCVGSGEKLIEQGSKVARLAGGIDAGAEDFQREQAGADALGLVEQRTVARGRVGAVAVARGEDLGGCVDAGGRGRGAAFCKRPRELPV